MSQSKCGLQRTQKNSTWFINSPQGPFTCPGQHPGNSHHFWQRLFEIHRVGEFLWLMDFWVCGNFLGGDVLFIFYLNICSSHLLPTSLGALTAECSALEFTVNHSNPGCIHTQFYSWANNLSRNIFKRLHICSLPMELNLVGMSIPGCNKLKQKPLRHRDWVPGINPCFPLL